MIEEDNGAQEELNETPQEEHVDEARLKPWVDVIKGNRLSYNGIEIEYIAPIILNEEVEVVIDEQDITL